MQDTPCGVCGKIQSACRGATRVRSLESVGRARQPFDPERACNNFASRCIQRLFPAGIAGGERLRPASHFNKELYNMVRAQDNSGSKSEGKFPAAGELKATED